MMQDRKNIVVCCPGGAISGGPELLHQLVHELRSIGKSAFISYFPFENQFELPKAYSGYDAPQTGFLDDPDSVFIIPENSTHLVRKIHEAGIFVWWLSVDNYVKTSRSSWLRDAVNALDTLMRGRQPLFLLKRHRHLVQSEYARNYLQRSGIDSAPLTDYLAGEHFSRDIALEDKQDIVAFNPKKGFDVTRQLIESLPRLQFVGIDGLEKAEVAALLSKAKIYIDFGHHPGKDRMPREAAIAGCCVITGRSGAAANPEDIPIPDCYKLEDLGGVDVDAFSRLADSIFRDFNDHHQQFSGYRRKIRSERQTFSMQVRSVFGDF